MRTIFSTDQVHQRDRFEYWYDVARQSIVDHDAKPACRKTFRAELRADSIGATKLALFQNSDMTVSHTKRHISRVDAHELFICRQRSGRVALEQGGRQVSLGSGDVALLDPALPYEGHFSGGSELLVLKVRRDALEARLGKVGELTARPMLPTADSRLISAYLAMLPAQLSGLSAEMAELVEPQLLDLVTLSFGRASKEARLRGSSARSLVRMRLRAAIDARLSDRALNAEAVARAAGVSLRYANAVLADEGTSIMQLLHARRLERCRQALADPAQAHRTVSEIAYGWGFSDMSHFGRRFRALFGMLPSEFRRSTQMASTRDLQG